MTDRLDVARGRNIAAGWCSLAEQRVEHLTELYESGRWRRYHSEAAFLENIQEAKNAVETWGDLLAYENSSRDLCRPSSVRSQPPPGRTAPEPVLSIASILRTSHLADKTFAAPKPERPALSVSASVLASPVFDPSMLTSNDEGREQADSRELDSQETRTPVVDVAALTIDFEAIKSRYPLLRNVL